jgi:uncharacterized SAM-binding protein YcdF (DUF218 family)
MRQKPISDVPRRVLAGLIQRKESWCLSLRAKFLVLVILVCGLVIVQRTIYSWLAITQPVSGEYLVVEGWLHGEGFDEASAEFRRGNYRKILTSGCRATDGSRTKSRVSYADWGAERLRDLGISSNLVEAVPSWIERRDRTYHSALAVKRWFVEHRLSPKAINVVSLGPHARRTRLLFQKALGKDVVVGVIATPDDMYDQLHWWRSSEGVREVVGEGLAYVYARIFFRPGAEDTVQPGESGSNTELKAAFLGG